MKTVQYVSLVLASIAAFHAVAAVTPCRNLAYRRAAYHSSSIDFKRTGQLVTDGSLSGADFLNPQVASQAPDRSPPMEMNVCAFDGKNETKWLQFSAQAWIQVTFPAPVPIASYKITSANDAANRDPKDWRLLGSNDGKQFSEIEKRSGEKFENRFVTRQFKLAKPVSYRVYRLDITANSGDKGDNGTGPRIQLAEWDLLNQGGKTVLRPDVGQSAPFISTWTSAGKNNEWVYVDLGAESLVDSVILHWGVAGAASSYDIQVSDNAKTWNTVASKNGGKGGRETLAFQPVKARYLRLLCKETPFDHYNLAEWEIWGQNDLSYQLPPAPDAESDGSLRLTGGNWKLCRASDISASGIELSGPYDDSAWLPAVVPGTVLTSFQKAGAIPDMNIADNQLMISDSFFTANFWYRNTFIAPPVEKGMRTWLNFDAINWKADVFLNGAFLGQINGSFLRKRFDVTDRIRPGAENRLAVLIRANDNPGNVTVQDLHSPGSNGGILGADNPTIHASVGWDWTPTIRGRNIGIYRDVFLSHSRDVTLSDGWAIPELDVVKKDFSRASVELRVRARNIARKPTLVTLQGTITPGNLQIVSTPVVLAPGETREITVGSATVRNPKLWWPVTYGEQPLYTAKLTAFTQNGVSDRHEFRFGIRKFTYKKGKPMEIFCNGTRIICRGGNWGMDDANLAATPADYDTKVRLHAEANLNMIRNWVGMTNHKAFYDACDQYGVLIWDDFWLANPADGPDPANQAMFLENARDKILKNRHHAALVLYCGRNEGQPPKGLFEALPKLIGETDNTRHYIPHSADNTVSGFGPYGVQNPVWYFLNTPHTLHSERGQPNIPEIESMRAMLTPAHYWPIDNVWGMHDFTEGGAQNGAAFMNYLKQSYGTPTDLDDFVRRAQFVTYENHKAMFEAVYASNGNGLLMWMSQSAWPSMVWQTYDYWHDINGGYAGAKAGNQPRNIIFNQATKNLWLVNATPHPLLGATAAIELFTLDGRKLYTGSERVSLEADGLRVWRDLPQVEDVSPIRFIRTSIRDGNGQKLSENFTWYNMKGDRNYRELANLPPANVSVTAERSSVTQNGAQGELTLVNRGDSPALLIRVTVTDEQGNRILPVHYSDNYVSLMPGETRRLTWQAPRVTSGKCRVSLAPR